MSVVQLGRNSACAHLPEAQILWLGRSRATDMTAPPSAKNGLEKRPEPTSRPQHRSLQRRAVQGSAIVGDVSL